MKKLFLAFISILLTASIAHAVPKSTPCKPYKTDICVDKRSIPNSFKRRLPYKKNFLMPLQRYPLSSSFQVPPENNPPGTSIPQILIPAGINSITVCNIVGGQMNCTVLTAFKPCPSRFTFTDESGQAWTCDVDCNARRPNGDPDSNGNCDCDIEYDTCTQGYN